MQEGPRKPSSVLRIRFATRVQSSSQNLVLAARYKLCLICQASQRSRRGKRQTDKNCSLKHSSTICNYAFICLVFLLFCFLFVLFIVLYFLCSFSLQSLSLSLPLSIICLCLFLPLPLAICLSLHPCFSRSLSFRFYPALSRSLALSPALFLSLDHTKLKNTKTTRRFGRSTLGSPQGAASEVKHATQAKKVKGLPHNSAQMAHHLTVAQGHKRKNYKIAVEINPQNAILFSSRPTESAQRLHRVIGAKRQ